jgi:hypothetical protein
MKKTVSEILLHLSVNLFLCFSHLFCVGARGWEDISFVSLNIHILLSSILLMLFNYHYMKTTETRYFNPHVLYLLPEISSYYIATLSGDEWVNNCCLMPTCAAYWSIFWREQFAFGWDDDHVHIVLDHRIYLAFYSTNSLKHDHVRIVLDHRTYLALYSTNSLKHDHVRIVLDHRTYLAFYSTKSLKH